MVDGIYRNEFDWVMVLYGSNRMAVSRTTYEDRRYQPPFDELPSEEQYNAQQKPEKIRMQLTLAK